MAIVAKSSLSVVLHVSHAVASEARQRPVNSVVGVVVYVNEYRQYLVLWNKSVRVVTVEVQVRR